MAFTLGLTGGATGLRLSGAAGGISGTAAGDEASASGGGSGRNNTTLKSSIFDFLRGGVGNSEISDAGADPSMLPAILPQQVAPFR